MKRNVLKDENTKEKNSNLKRKKSNNNKNYVKIFLIIIALLVIFILVLFAINTYLNSKIRKLANISDENSYIEYVSKFPKLYLTKNTADEMKNKNLFFNVKYKENEIVFASDDYNNGLINFALKEEKRTFENDLLKNASTLYVDCNNFYECIITLPTYLDNSAVDIYILNTDDSIDVYKSCVKVENSKITINSCEKEIKGYIIAYIKTEDILIENLEDGVLNIGKDETKKIDIKVIPENATIKDVNIISNDEEKLKVEDINNIKGIQVGDSSIKLTSGNFEKNINVHISNYATAIVLNVDTINLTVGQTYDLFASTIPEDAENNALNFEIEDTSIANVDGNTITALEVGETVMKVRTISGTSLEEYVNINVTDVVYSNQAENLTYINGILIANKTYSLPQSYNPGGLTYETLEAFNKMKEDAANEGINLWISSGFRSYETQYGLYNRYVSQYGQESADTFSARAGHSEHQTGLAMDINQIEDWFGDTQEGIWVANNCYKYGFIIRYPKSKEAITGYKYEPWHIRYLGVNIATDVYNSGLCLEEYLNITSRYDE